MSVLRLWLEALAGDGWAEKIVAPTEFWLKGRDAHRAVFKRQD